MTASTSPDVQAQPLAEVPLFTGDGRPRLRVDQALPAARGGSAALEAARCAWAFAEAAGRSTRMLPPCADLTLVAAPAGGALGVAVRGGDRRVAVPHATGAAVTPLAAVVLAGLLHGAPMAGGAWRRYAGAEPDPVLATVCALAAEPDARMALAAALGLPAARLPAWVEAEAEAAVWALAHPDPAVAGRAYRRTGAVTRSPLLLPRFAAAARSASDADVRARIGRAHHRLGRRTLVTAQPGATAPVRRNTYGGRYRMFDELVADLVQLLDGGHAIGEHSGVDIAAWRSESGPAVLVVDEAASDGRTTGDLATELRSRPLARPVRVVGRDVNMEFTEEWSDSDTVSVLDASGRCLWSRTAGARSNVAHDGPGGTRDASGPRRFRWLAPDLPDAEHDGPVRLAFESHDLFASSEPPADVVRAFGVLYERLRTEADADSYFDTVRITAGLRQLGRALRPGGVLMAGSVVDDVDDTSTFVDVDVFQRRDDREPRLVRVRRHGLGLGPAAPPLLSLLDTDTTEENDRPMQSNGAAAGTDVWPGRTAASFDPWPPVAVHVEWGSTAAKLAAARGDDIVIVDVLSFSTTLTLAAEHGIDSYVYSGPELDTMGGRDAVARSVGARPAAAKRAAGPGQVSLSPASIVGAGPGAVLFTSLNGALAVSTAGAAPILAVGCLRNYRAAARLAAQRLASRAGTRVTVVACGEHWSSVSDEDGLRPCAEDLLGAGAIAAELAAAGYTVSPEAAAAAATFTALGGMPAAIVGARELVAAGFADDVRLAAELDVTDLVPVRDDSDPSGRRFRGVRVAVVEQ